MQKILNYIDGKHQQAVSGQFLDNYNPSTGEVYSLIADSDAQDIAHAYKAAEKAFKGWKNTPTEKRAAILLKIAQLIKENLEELAKAESIDNGKPLWLAKAVDIPRAASNFEFYASGIKHWASNAHFTDQIAINYTKHEPYGVVGCISPWNLPLYLFSWKIAPALAVGNTVVAKPSEVTPMTAYLLTKICDQAGLPKGVLNVVHGLGQKAGNALVEHPKIEVISFTGGTKTGAEIASKCAPHFKKLSLELGGKNPNIIFDDCDFEKAVDTSVKASFSNQGQICLCGSRILVHASIYEKFKAAFVEKSNALNVGDPLEKSSNLGAVVSKEHMHKILACVEQAKQEGGTILLGGKRLNLSGKLKDGYYVEPTIIEGLDNNCKTNQEEIFGPVVTLQSFEDEDQAIALANDTRYGLSATIFTENLSRAHRVSNKLQAGLIWVNTWLLRDLRTPFGGVKQSGIGREGGFKAFKFFTQTKNVCIKV